MWSSDVHTVLRQGLARAKQRHCPAPDASQTGICPGAGLEPVAHQEPSPLLPCCCPARCQAGRPSSSRSRVQPVSLLAVGLGRQQDPADPRVPLSLQRSTSPAGTPTRCPRTRRALAAASKARPRAPASDPPPGAPAAWAHAEAAARAWPGPGRAVARGIGVRPGCPVGPRLRLPPPFLSCR